MRILHICLIGLFNDEFFYQDNMLTMQNAAEGHTVQVIASTEKIINGVFVDDRLKREYINEYGVKIIRIPNVNLFSKRLNRKICAYRGVRKLIEDFLPNILYLHGTGGWVSFSISKYLKKNTNVSFFMDCHSDYENSATTFLSKYLLHKIFHHICFNSCVKYAKKLYYVAPESIQFLRELYNFTDTNKLEFLPLGGYVIEEEEKQSLRKKIRKELGIDDSNIVLIHSGKLSKEKKSLELIEAFNEIDPINIWLLIVGKFDEDVYLSVKNYINDNDNIKYLGWQPANKLEEYLCAADVYVQPGTRTVTVQHAACCGCSLLINRSLLYTTLFGNIPLYAENKNELMVEINKIINCPDTILNQKQELFKIAKTQLDYKVIANRYINESKEYLG